jgi:DNA-binding GntR family transcriptional regulator
MDRHLQISQEEIANLTGVSRQRCNAALKRLQESGILQIEYGGITVLDLPGLRRYVE